MRWIIALVLVTLAGAGAVLAVDAWSASRRVAAEVEHLSGQRAQVARLLGEKAEAERRKTEAAALAVEIEASGLDPAAWVHQPLAVNRNLSWRELERLLKVAGSDPKAEGGHWYRPRLLRVARVAGQATSEPAAEGAADRSEQKPPEDAFASLPPHHAFRMSQVLIFRRAVDT